MTSIDTSAGERKAIAKREWINDDGEKVVAGDPSAVGFRYTYLATGKSVEYVIGEAGKLSTMFGIMGGLTKVGNIVNSVVNDDSYDGSADPMGEVESWLKDADAGVWREPGEGVARGPKYDPDLMGKAIYAAAKAEGLDVSKTNPVTLAQKYRDDRSYAAKVRARPQVITEYAKIAPTPATGMHGLV